MYFDKIGNHITTVHEEEKRFVTVVVLFYDFFLPIDLFFLKWRISFVGCDTSKKYHLRLRH